LIEGRRLKAKTTLPALALVWAVLMAAVHGLAQDPEARYQSLLEAAKAGDKTVDWQALRFAYADRPGFTSTVEGDERTHALAMRQAFKAGDYAGAIVEAKAVMDEDFVDPEAHLIASQAYAKSRFVGEAQREKAMAVGLLTSIQTGDGRSAATAYSVISVKEEYVLMATSGRRVTRQSLTQQDGHSYDVLETVDSAGAVATFYFQIDRVLAAESHVLRLHR
jgi:hypothetical protein